MISAIAQTAFPVARLGLTHGYCFDGDLVLLNADLQCDLAGLTGQDWALQLWADDNIKVAELPLGQIYPDAAGQISVAGNATALPPAGEGPHTLSLAIVSGANGIYDAVHDQTTYAQPQSFIQPRLKGTVGCSFLANEVILDLACIENPRAADNISGTLSLEVWALSEPYTGGAWVGTPIASLVIGSLEGQTEWANSRFTAHAAPVPAEGELTVMLREWTPAGYVTRDFRALTRPGVAAAAAEPAEAAPKAAKAKKAAKAEKTDVVEKAPAKKAKAADKKEVKAEKENKKAEKAASKGVSVNKATAAEITAVKGISDAVAAAIIAARPYASLDELVRAKGMGAKLLEKVRSSFSL